MRFICLLTLMRSEYFTQKKVANYLNLQHILFHQTNA